LKEIDMLRINEFLKIGWIVFGLLGVVPVGVAQVQWLPSEEVKSIDALKVDRKEGDGIQICRCLFNGNLYAGGVIDGKCSIGWGGKEIKNAEYNLLVKSSNMQISWKSLNGYGMPSGAVVGGREGTRFCYIGRLQQPDGTLHLGRIIKSKKGYEFHYGLNGKEEIANSNFEILIANHKR
jgi:hypothetical protein